MAGWPPGSSKKGVRELKNSPYGNQAMLQLKDDRIVERFVIDVSIPDDEQGFDGIRCPRCHWRPQPSSRWRCDCARTPEPPFDACGTAWNTFSTKGRCPGCSHQWQWTSCLRCGESSLHIDWYEPNYQRPT
jgi:hypothetical protein